MSRHLDANGPRQGILSDGTRVTVYHQPGVGDAWTAVLEGGAWEEMAHGNMLPMLGMSERPEHGISQFTEGMKGRHLGTQVPWQAVPEHIREHIELRATPDRMASNGDRGAPLVVRMTDQETRMYRSGNKNAMPGLLGIAQDKANRNNVEVSIVDSQGNEIEWCTPEIQRNGRASTVDDVALRELDLYISNTYELVGAPNSRGKSIDANLRRKLDSGKYNSALAPQAWQYLADEGAKSYQREFGSDSPIFSAATRRALAEAFARAWEEENGVGMQRNASAAPKKDRFGRLVVTSIELADGDNDLHTRRWQRDPRAPSGTGQRAPLIKVDMIKVPNHPDYVRSTGDRFSRLHWCDACEQYTEWQGGECANCSVRPVDYGAAALAEDYEPNAARRVPQHLQGYEDFTNDEFYQDLRSKGYTHAQARVQAKSASYQIGKLDFLPPKVPKGWILFRDPIMRRRDAKVAFVAHKGSRFVVYDQAGKAISPELRRIRGLLEWQDQNGWRDATPW